MTPGSLAMTHKLGLIVPLAANGGSPGLQAGESVKRRWALAPALVATRRDSCDANLF
jgi:hypothetical protein